MEALSEGRGEGRGEEAGAEDCGGGCRDGGEGILQFHSLPMSTSALQAQLFNIYTQEEGRMRKNRE